MENLTPEFKSLERAYAILNKDLEALPETAFTQKFGPATRTVCDIVYEINMVNDHISMGLRGEEGFPWPDVKWITAPPEFNTKEITLAALKASQEKVLQTAGSFSAEQLLELTKTSQGDTPRGERLRFMTLHIWYHSGQFNFIQALLGDDDWHW